MAIVFNCPHCSHAYKLKDEFAGKRATCKNPNCREVITVPSPDVIRIADLGGIVPDDAPANAGAPPVDAEAAALAALSETVKEKEDTAAANEIPVVCPHCDHKWVLPSAMAGKNTLCPNEECRQRIKVPELKKGAARDDWRSTASGKPSLAKENFEKPTDVMDAESKVVSREAYVQGGGAEQDLEPVTLKRKLFVWSLIAAPILLVAAGVWAVVSWRGGQREEMKMEPALEEFNASREEFDPVQACLASAILELAAGEYSLHPKSMEKDKALGQAHVHFKKALRELQEAANKDPQNKALAERYAVTGELALALVGLGGSDEQVKAGERDRWLPEPAGNRPLRVNEKTLSVHSELSLVLAKMLPADFDTKAVLIRRLTRDLVKRGQPEVAEQVIGSLFSDPEQPEAKAIVALEVYRPNRSSAGLPSRIGDELRTTLAGGAVGRSPTPASAQTLWQIVGTAKAPNLFPPPGGGAVNEASRFAYVGTYLLSPGEEGKALDLAKQQGGTLPGQLRALALYAEWANDPGPAFDSALSAINLAAKAKKESPPTAVVLRLSQLAASTNRAEQSKQLADLIPDEGAKAWAKGSAIQFAAAAGNKDRVEDTALEIPTDAKKLRAGHLWGKMWQARQNTRVLKVSETTKQVNLWPKGTIKPFGLAGIALAQHDDK